VQVAYGSAGSIPVTISGQYVGSEIAVPTGLVSYSIINSGSTVVASSTASISSGAASVQVANTLAVGAYTVSLKYAGDSNYNSATAATAALQVGGITTPTITWTQPAPITYGISLSGILHANATSGSITIAGTFNYTATPAGGSASPVTTTTLLSAGSYVLTASFSPANTALYGTATGEVTLAVGQATPALSWAKPAPITYGAALGSVLNPTATFNSSTVPGTFTYTATPTGGSATAVSSATLLTAGSYTLSATFTPANSTGYASANTTTTELVNQAASALKLSSSLNPVLLLNPTILTANVSSTAGVPSGTITFLDEAGPIASASLANGVAGVTVANLPVGSHSLSASYSGDTNFSASTSGTLTQAVIDFTTTPGGSGAGGPSQTVTPGGAATFSLSIVPTSGLTLPTPAVFTLTGMPAGATANVSPSSWIQTSSTSWTFPANTQLSNIALTIQLPAANGRMDGTNPLRQNLPLLCCLLLFPFAGSLRRRLSRLRQTLSMLFLMAMGLFVLTGCGSGNGFFNQHSQTYTITGMVTSGALSHSTTITLTVQ
jgi:Bacterial Ig-like domain (group 3)